MKMKYEIRGKHSERVFGFALSESAAERSARFMCENEPVEIFDRVKDRVVKTIQKPDEEKK